LIEKGVKNFEQIAVEAAGSGRKDIVESMIERGAKNYDQIACRAACLGHKDIPIDDH
jgi:hypothetical protein